MVISRSTPGLTSCSRDMDAEARKISVSRISALTPASCPMARARLQRRWSPLVDAPTEALRSPSIGSTAAARIAGASEAIAATPTAATCAKSTTLTSGLNVIQAGQTEASCVPANLTENTSFRSKVDSGTARKSVGMTRTTVSIRLARKSRPRLAPSAVRTASSPLRRMARAVSREAALAASTTRTSIPARVPIRPMGPTP